MQTTRYKLGVAIALVGAVLGIVVSLFLFVRWYEPVVLAEIAAGRPDEGVIVEYIFPALNDVSVVAGIFWALAAYGFLTERSWGWTLAVVANVLALQGSFFTMIPPVTRGLSPYTMVIFLPNLVAYGLLLFAVRKVDWRIAVVGLFSGIAMVLSFMNGVASTNKMITTEMTLFVAVQRLNWIAAAGWGVFTIGLLLRPAEWVRLTGLGAGLLEITVGLPLGIVTAIEAGRFSMFLPAPLLSLALVILLALPWGRRIAPQLKPSAA
ncbi:MAG: hypothetical protein ACP5HM_14200 [Anaerolineae bacterium]